jgi:ketosteroid isomerase-like protein
MVFVARGELVGRTEYHGFDGVRAAMAEVSESWAELKPRVKDVLEVGDDRCLITQGFHLRSHSGVELEVDEFWAVWMRDGQFARIEQHGGREEALAALRAE